MPFCSLFWQVENKGRFEQWNERYVTSHSHSNLKGCPRHPFLDIPSGKEQIEDMIPSQKPRTVQTPRVMLPLKISNNNIMLQMTQKVTCTLYCEGGYLQLDYLNYEFQKGIELNNNRRNRSLDQFTKISEFCSALLGFSFVLLSWKHWNIKKIGREY